MMPGLILTMKCIAATRPDTVKIAYAKKGHISR